MSDVQRIVVRGFGGVERLEPDDSPTPAPGPKQLLIEVEAAGVAYADILMRTGIYPETPKLPFTPGYDVVGHVLAVGPGADATLVGKRVAALCVTGGYARQAIVPAAPVALVPDDQPAPQVVALVLNYVTAYQMLHRVADVSTTQAVLVLGAAGGVGTALVQLAVAAGVRCYGTASGARTGVVAANGGIPLDRTAVDIVTTVRAHEPGGVAAVFDAVGGPSLRTSQDAAAKNGVVVSYGVSFGLDAGLGRSATMMRHGQALTKAKLRRGAKVTLYVIAGKRGFTSKHADSFADDMGALISLLRKGTISPLVETMPLGDAQLAQQRVEAGSVAGKLVLIP